MDVEADPTVGSKPDDARSADLGDEQSAVGEGRVAIGECERRRWMVDADAGAAPLADDLLRGVDLEDTAVPDVGGDDVPVGQWICVVGRVQLAAAGPGRAVSAVLPDHASRRDIDAIDDLMRFVVRDDRLPVGRHECIVRGEQLTRREAARHREPPDDLASVRDDQEPPVAAVGDQQTARETGRWWGTVGGGGEVGPGGGRGEAGVATGSGDDEGTRTG